MPIAPRDHQKCRLHVMVGSWVFRAASSMTSVYQRRAQERRVRANKFRFLGDIHGCLSKKQKRANHSSVTLVHLHVNVTRTHWTMSDPLRCRFATPGLRKPVNGTKAARSEKNPVSTVCQQPDTHRLVARCSSVHA